MCVPCFVMQYFVSFLALQSSCWGRERAASFTLIVFLITRDCYCSIAFPHGAVGWSAVHDCGISWSDSLIILVLSCNGLYIFKSFLFAEIQIESSG